MIKIYQIALNALYPHHESYVVKLSHHEKEIGKLKANIVALEYQQKVKRHATEQLKLALREEIAEQGRRTELLREGLLYFIKRVEQGTIRSKETYTRFIDLLSRTEKHPFKPESPDE